MFRQIFSSYNKIAKKQLSNESKLDQPQQQVSTIIWLTECKDLQLSTEKNKCECLELVASDIRNNLSTLKQSKQVYLSYPDFLQAFGGDLQSIAFSSHNCFTTLSVPTEAIETATTTFTKKKLTWITKNLSLADCQIQFCLILNTDLDIEKPIAMLVNNPYKRLSQLIASPTPDLNAIAQEINQLYIKHGNGESPLNIRVKNWKDLLDIFELISLNNVANLKESYVKQAVLNLLGSSKSISSHLSSFSKILSDSLTILPPCVIDTIKEYKQPNVFALS